MSTRTPLPAGVYWRRRLVVLSVALAVFVMVGKALSGSSDGADAADQAVQAGAAASPAAVASSNAAAGKKKNKKNKTKIPTPTPTPTPLAQPTGPCSAKDVLITPTLPEPIAGRDVTIVLNLQMGTTEACTWRVSTETVTLKITAGVDDIWSSRECPKVIPTQDVVIRREVSTAVTVLWNSKRSDEYCTVRTAWALPGPYEVAAAALQGEPTTVKFELTRPVAAVVTETAAPSPTAKPKGKKNKNKQRD